MQKENRIMTTLDMLRLKMVEEEEEDLVILIFLAIFQIFLKISLVKDLVEVEDQENLIIGGLI